MKTKYDRIIEFSENETSSMTFKNYSSEGFFWLTTAATTGFALEEMHQYLNTKDDVLNEKVQEITEKLKKTIVHGAVLPEDQEKAQTYALENIERLKEFANSSCLIFNYKNVTVLAKTIATYWLTNKLIELEIQEVLSEDEIRSVYIFLDTVINDHEEIEIIEEKLSRGEELSLDEKVYLRGSWQRGLYFWSRLYQELFLLSEKVIPFKRQ